MLAAVGLYAVMTFSVSRRVRAQPRPTIAIEERESRHTVVIIDSPFACACNRSLTHQDRNASGRNAQKLADQFSVD